jgi:FMN phosphatase YigB (HAD superfamily)
VDPIEFRACKAVLFDFGGTLDAEGEHWLDRFFALYEDMGLPIPREEIKKAFYLADARCRSDPEVPALCLRSLVSRHVRLQFSFLGIADNDKERRLAYRFCDRAAKFLSQRALLFSRMKSRFRIGVVSNFFGNLDRVCTDAGLRPYLDAIVDSGVVGVRKPDPAIFRIALQRIGCEPQHAIFVGDSYERDMMPSMELGMRTVWLKGPHPRIPESAKPVDASIDRLRRMEVLVA